MLEGTFLEGVDAPKRHWHEPSAQQKGISPAYRWTGPGRDRLGVAYGKAESRPNAATVREVWRQRHGYRAAVLCAGCRTSGCRRLSTTLRSGRRQEGVDSCMVAGADGTLAKIDLGAPRRRRPRTPAPPEPPKRCPYQRPGSGPRPPLARRTGRGGGGGYRAAGHRTGAAAGALRGARRALRPQGYDSLLGFPSCLFLCGGSLPNERW